MGKLVAIDFRDEVTELTKSYPFLTREEAIIGGEVLRKLSLDSELELLEPFEILFEKPIQLDATDYWEFIEKLKPRISKSWYESLLNRKEPRLIYHSLPRTNPLERKLILERFSFSENGNFITNMNLAIKLKRENLASLKRIFGEMKEYMASLDEVQIMKQDYFNIIKINEYLYKLDCAKFKIFNKMGHINSVTDTYVELDSSDLASLVKTKEETHEFNEGFVGNQINIDVYPMKLKKKKPVFFDKVKEKFFV